MLVTGDNVNPIGGKIKPPETPVDTSSSLLERIKNSDQGAWERFVHLYSPLVYRWCRQAGLQEADAADVGQEVFRAVASAIAQFHKNKKGDTFRGWLRTITINKLRDFGRRARKESRGEGGSEAQEKLGQIPAAELPNDESSLREENLLVYRRAIEMVLESYEERTRNAFLQVVVDGRAPRDVAKDMGMTVNAIYLAKSRILRRIREEFADLLVS